jgi:Pectinacetylesterase
MRTLALCGFSLFACGAWSASPVSPANGIEVMLADCAADGEVGYPPAGQVLQLYTLPTALFPDAVCNDGSPAIFYFRPGTGVGARSWLIELEGGGGCRSAADCASRWCSVDTNFGRQGMSSTRFAARVPSMAGQGVQSIVAGPFATWNHVFVHYCSSDRHAGVDPGLVASAAHPVTGANVTFLVRFNGNTILDAVLRVLRRDGAVLPPFTLGGVSPTPMPDLDDAADTVVFAGPSAGGDALEFQLDRLVATLRVNHNQAIACPAYLGLIDSAFQPEVAGLGFQFTSECATAGACDWKSYLEANTPYYRQVTDTSCEALHPSAAEAFKCLDQTHLVRNHVTTPVFLRQGETDQLLSGNAVSAALATSPSAASVITGSDWEGLVRAQAELLPSWGTRSEEPPVKLPGGFAPRCANHDTLNENSTWFQTTIGAWTWGDAWNNWVSARSPSVVVSDPARAGTASICR